MQIQSQQVIFYHTVGPPVLPNYSSILKYNKSKNINYLQKACENAPFFGNPEMGKEISKLLGELKILKKNCE